MSKNVHTEAVNHLFDAILSLENKEECYRFFEDVCTVNELLSLSQRYEVARMLRAQKTYLDIAEKTGASTATISRVNRSLNYGSDGYDMMHWLCPTHDSAFGFVRLFYSSILLFLCLFRFFFSIFFGFFLILLRKGIDYFFNQRLFDIHIKAQFTDKCKCL